MFFLWVIGTYAGQAGIDDCIMTFLAFSANSAVRYY